MSRALAVVTSGFQHAQTDYLVFSEEQGGVCRGLRAGGVPSGLLLRLSKREGLVAPGGTAVWAQAGSGVGRMPGAGDV